MKIHLVFCLRAGRIGKALLLEIITDFIEDDEDEGLKLRIIDAIQNQ